MTQSKAVLFDRKLQQLAGVYKVLGHPARLAILQYLAKNKNCVTGNIANRIPLARTTINQHLAELKKFELIKGEICGTKISYCLNTKKIRSLKINIVEFMNDLNTDFDMRFH